jgi:hypothetical protein
MPTISSASKSVVAAAALALTGTAAAQQLAANQDPWADAPQFVEQRCGTGNEAKYKSGAGLNLYIDCVTEAQIAHARQVREKAEREAEAARASADKDTADLNTEARCLGIIAEGLTSKRITPGDVRDARKGPPPTTDVCVVVGRLQRQLSALTK